MSYNPTDILPTNGRDFRFLFNHGDKDYRLFYFSYQSGEFYIGSSQSKIFCGQHRLGEVISENEKHRIIIDTELQDKEYKSLKFSFHKFGERHLRGHDKNNRDTDFVKEQAKKLSDLEGPELLFTLISKRINLYHDYTSPNRTKKDRNAIVFYTPSEYTRCRNVFEFYASNSDNKEFSISLNPEVSKKDHIVIKLDDKLFFHIKFFINAPETHPVNLEYFDREVMLFTHDNKLKFFSFK